MKFSSGVFLTLAALLHPSFASPNLRRHLQGNRNGNGNANGQGNGNAFGHRNCQGNGASAPETCTGVIREINHGEEQAGERKLDCVADDNTILEVDVDEQFVETAIRRGDLMSGRVTMDCPGCQCLPNGKVRPNGNPEFLGGRRELSSGRKLDVIGTRSVLVVRVTHAGNGNLGSTSADANQLANDVFGSQVGGSDTFNLHSQMLACSYGQLEFEPYITGNFPNAVAEVSVSTNCATTPCNGQMVNDAIGVLNNNYGTGWNADHVMFCLPPTAMGGIAYAGVNSWYSVYSDNWCRHPSAQMHEIGHNIDLLHSGENEGKNNDQYRDKSGMMGFSYGQLDGPVMCFNSAKSWQLGWYSQYEHTFEPSDGFWQGTLVGISEIGSPTNNSGHTAVVKINNPGSSTDHYLNFNRQSGINSGTKEGGNQVMIVSQAGEGTNDSQSWLEAKLNQGGTFTISYSGYPDITVTVNTIDLSTTPATAVVTLSTPGVSPPPVTSEPTPAPVTPAPIPSPTPAPVTPAPVTPAPTPSPTPAPVTSAPTPSPTPAPVTSAPTPTPTPAPVTPAPTPLPTPAPITSAPTPAPVTPQPIPSPTQAPVTLAPTPSPTPAPITLQPTPSPTPAPITSQPTPSPSPAPVTPAPTPSPTPAPTPSPTPAPTPSPTPAPITPPACLGRWSGCSVDSDCCSGACGIWIFRLCQ